MRQDTQGQELERYFDRVRRLPKLSREEEHEVAVAAARGDERAVKRLVEANLRYVIAIALQYRRYGVPLGELVGEGNLEPDFVQQLRRYKLRGSSGKVNLAVDRLPSFTSRPGAGPHLEGDIAICPSVEYVERAFDDVAEQARLPFGAAEGIACQQCLQVPCYPGLVH